MVPGSSPGGPNFSKILENLGFKIRNQAIRVTRQFFADHGFLESWTNQLTTQPAIEPYIDSFSVGGKYLATSPELALKKTIALTSEEPRIYEIAHSFRDEMTSKSHLNEFVLLEWYSMEAKVNEWASFVLSYIKKLQENLPCIIQSIELEQVRLEKIWQTILGINPKGFTPEILFESAQALAQKNLISSPQVEQSNSIELFSQILDVLLKSFFKNRPPGLTAISGFPAMVRGMAKIKNGEALRMELYLNGTEIANGYQEEHAPEQIQALLNHCNQIRKTRNLPEYQIEKETLRLLPRIKGASGMALGIERVLGELFQSSDIQKFCI